MSSLNQIGLGDMQTAPKTFKGPVSVLWHITKGCELSCPQCYYDADLEGFDADLSDEMVLDIADQLVSCEIVNVFISGGEPLARKNMLQKIIPMFAENKIIVTVITSGYGMTSEDVELFSKYNVEVVVGLDGSNPKIHDGMRGKPGSFEQAVNALKMLAGKVPSLKVEFLLTSANIDDFGNVVDLVAGIGKIDIIEIHSLVQRGRALKSFGSSVDQTERQKLMELIANKNEQYNKVPYSVFNEPTLSLRRILRLAKPNTGVVIGNDGTLMVNPWVPVTFGSLKEDNLVNLWNKGLNTCWQGDKMTGVLRGMKTVNEMGEWVHANEYRNVSYYSL